MKLKAMLASRMFWAALVGLLMVVARAALPAFPLENEALTQVLYVIGAYIFGEAVEGGGAVAGWRDVLTSRKFWASLVAAGMVVLHSFFPGLALNESQVEQLVWVLVTFIAGVGIADSMQKDKRAGQPADPGY
jgi:uncharacterized membrane protein YdjX (TVP38/TMEM64 family)